MEIHETAETSDQLYWTPPTPSSAQKQHTA